MMKTMDNDRVHKIVAAVIDRLMVRLKVDGRRGAVIAVFSGGTVQLPEAVRQVQRLILGGYKVHLAFTPSAERLYAAFVRRELGGFPYDEIADDSSWLSSLTNARAVVVPLLSVNTLSKLTLLIADTLPLNLILHGLLMGKPVIMAQNGADPEDAGRMQLGIAGGGTVLLQEIRARFQRAADYGCRLVDVRRLKAQLDQELTKVQGRGNQKAPAVSEGGSKSRRLSEKIVTAGHVRQAIASGSDLTIPFDSIITPLARDLAQQHGLPLVRAALK